FNLGDREVLIFPLYKFCSIEKVTSGFFFLQVSIYFLVCNSPSNEVKKTMTLHAKFQDSFISNCLKGKISVRPWIFVNINAVTGRVISIPDFSSIGFDTE